MAGELRDQIARAICGYDWDHGISANPDISKHQRGEADAVMAIVRAVTDGYASTTREQRQRAEQAEAAVERLKARHQPRTATQLIRCERHSKSWSGNHEMFKDCPDCREEQIQVCSNITCCGWPCDDFLALDQPTEGAPDAG